MQIDWTQTLLGQDARIASAATAGESMESRALSAALAGRMAGLLGAVLFMALMVVLAPLKPELGWRIGDLVALAGLLVLQVVAFALLRRAPEAGLTLFAPIALLQVLLVAGLAAPLAVISAAAGLAAAELMGMRLLFRGRNRMARGVFLAGLVALAAGLFPASDHGPLVLMLIGMAVPTVVMLALAPASSPLLDALEPAPRSTAMVAEPFREHPGLVLAVDSTGTLATEIERARFGWLASAAAWPYPL